MPRKRRTGGGDTEVPSVASQVDEADVVASVGAVEDPDTGTLVADEERVRAAGAVDAESVRENQRLNQIVDQKRGGVKVPFNAGDILVKYETLLRMWPSNTLEIGVKRLTGTQTQYTIKSQPRTGNELYDAIMQIHGRSGEAAYEVRVIDSNMKQIRTTGQITMPDTQATPPQPQPPQQGQPMTQYPYGYSPPQQQPYPQQQPQQPYPQQQQPYPPQQSYPQQQQPYPQQQQQPQPTVVVAPAPAPGFDLAAMMQLQQQMFDQMQKMQQAAAASMQQQPPAAYPQQPQPSPATFVMPPPPTQPDVGAMLAWQQQMFQMFQQMQQMMQQPQPPPAPAYRGRGAQPPDAQPQSSLGSQMPPVQPPPGMMFVPGFGYVPVETLFQALGAGGGRPGPGGSGGPPYRGPYGGPRPPYYGGQNDPSGHQGGGPPGYPGGPGQQQQPLAPPKTPAEQFRESITFIKTVANAAQEMQSLFPGQQQPAVETPEQVEDDSPVRVIDAGPAKLVINRKDGSARLWETGFANMDKVLKWVGEQREAIQKAHAEQPKPQLPPGYVEVTPGYQPPPGYVAIPVHDPRQIPQQAAQPAPQQPAPAQSALPQPPAEMPPPLAGSRPAPRAPWGAPPNMGGGA